LYPKAVGYLVFAILVSLDALGQSPSTSARFDVISIRENVSGGNREETPPLQNGRLRFTNVTVQGVLSLAYPFDPPDMKGGPDWVRIGGGTHYDIQATTEVRVATEEIYHQLLQTMLADRFQLRVHQETTERPVYALVPDRKGMKLKTTDPSSCVPASPEVTVTPNGTACGRPYQFNGRHFEGIGMTTATLARFLGLYTGRPVIDRSGHEGMIDIQIDFTPANRISNDPDGPPSIFDALPEQLGLRLQPERGSVGVLVIDRVERPSEN
jgi:uncharacterized protein (TIGR03435 family)